MSERVASAACDVDRDARVADMVGERAELETSGLGRVKVTATKDFVRKGASIVVAIRPEKLVLSNRPESGNNKVRGQLTTSAYLGSRSHFFVSVDGARERSLAVMGR